jgi:hypothetical protein
MKSGITTLTRVAVALSACLGFVAAHDGAAARDRGYDGSGFVARDHRMPPVVRDHRTTPIVRDHRVPRGPQGGVSVTSSGGRRGGSPCVRSVFGGPCFGL